MEQTEIVNVIKSLDIGHGQNRIIVGTSYNNDDDEECRKGRLLILEKENEKIKISTSFTVPGCVYDVCSINKKLAIAVNYQVSCNFFKKFFFNKNIFVRCEYMR